MLRTLKPQAGGVDGLSVKILDLFFPRVSEYFTFIINKCLASGKFPDALKDVQSLKIQIFRNYRITDPSVFCQLYLKCQRKQYMSNLMPILIQINFGGATFDKMLFKFELSLENIIGFRHFNLFVIFFYHMQPIVNALFRQNTHLG